MKYHRSIPTTYRHSFVLLNLISEKDWGFASEIQNQEKYVANCKRKNSQQPHSYKIEQLYFLYK